MYFVKPKKVAVIEKRVKSNHRELLENKVAVDKNTKEAVHGNHENQAVSFACMWFVTTDFQTKIETLHPLLKLVTVTWNTASGSS